MEPEASAELDRVVDHYVGRLRRGEHPNVEDYVQRHPELADEIRELFPLLSLMEGVKDGKLSQDAGDEGAVDAPLPATIAAYEIVRPIGRGGMGAVHEGRAADGSRVAVKVIHPHLLGETRYVARFLREAEVGSHIQHPNVVRTLESGVLQAGPRGAPYLVLEYVEGQSLRELLKEVGRVPERLCRHIGLCVARALEAFEEAGIVHRDLKPENIVITPDETVKVMDLGVARLHEAAEQLTQTGQFVGSFRYAAPEQLAGKRVDGRADLYALGVLLYELSTGVHPASARGYETVISAPPPSTLAPGLSPFLDGLVAKLMRPAPGDRFGDAARLREVLTAGERSAWWRREMHDVAPAVFTVETGSFCGRDHELETLDRAFTAVREGSGRTILLEGEAGIGKSRLLREWLRELGRSGLSPGVLLASHDPGEGSLDLFPLGTALLNHVGSEDLDETLRRHYGSDERLAVAFAQHLRGEGAERSGTGRLPGTLSVGLLRVLRSMAEEKPLIVAVEDLHFAGESTRSLVPYLSRGLADSRALLFVSTRPLAADDPLAEVLSLAHAERLRLEGLDTTARLAVLQEALGTGELDLRDLGELARKSDGNPYFLLELASSRTGVPPGELSETGDTSVPATLSAMLERRLAALSDEDRELLDVAACCGYAFDPELLSDAMEVGLIATLKRLGRLERKGGLVVGMDTAYRFHHHLLQEVLYEALHPSLRKAHHGALGTVLLARVHGPDSVEGAVAFDLCTHLFRGGRPREAAPYVLDASSHLRFQDEYARSTSLLHEALSEGALLDDAMRAEVLHLAGVGSHIASDHERADVCLKDACALAEALGLHELAVDALGSYAFLKLGRREPEEAVCLARAAVRVAQGSGDLTLEARAQLALAYERTSSGRAAEAQVALDAAAGIVESTGDVDIRYEAETVAARIGRLQGDLDRAAVHIDRALRIAREEGDRGKEFLSTESQGGLLYRLGRFADALGAAERAFSLGSEIGVLHHHASLMSNGAGCLLELGRIDEALTRADDALQIGKRLGQPGGTATAKRRRASTLIALGRLGEARSELAAMEAGHEMEQPSDPDVLWTVSFAGVLSALGRFEEARGILAASAVHREGFEDRHQVGRVLLAESMLLEREGRMAAALELARRVLSGRGPEGGSHGRIPLAAGRLALRVGDREAARTALEEALAWGRRSGCFRIEVPARVHLATLPGGDVLSARVELEQNEERLPRYDALEAHVALWEHTRDDTHLERARALLDILRAGAAPEDRDAMVERVDLYRRIAGA